MSTTSVLIRKWTLWIAGAVLLQSCAVLPVSQNQPFNRTNSLISSITKKKSTIESANVDPSTQAVLVLAQPTLTQAQLFEWEDPIQNISIYDQYQIAYSDPFSNPWAQKENLSNNASDVKEQIVSFAKKYLGKPYISRGYSERGFDCSGFTSYVLQHFDISVPRSSSAQAESGVEIPINDVRKGDLLFFGSRKGSSYRISHAAMVISDEGEAMKMIHSCSRGVVIDEKEGSAWKSYYGKRFLFAKRVVNDDSI